MNRLSSYETIVHPVISEKGTGMAEQGKYLFRVRRDSNKMEIKKAVQDIFKVKVREVNTMNVRGKMKRLRHRAGMTSAWKKAIVTLKKGEKIEFV